MITTIMTARLGQEGLPVRLEPVLAKDHATVLLVPQDREGHPGDQVLTEFVQLVLPGKALMSLPMI